MDHLKDFLTYLTVEKGLSRNTIESYHFDLRKFHDFLSSKGINFVSFTKADVIDFLEKLRGGNYSDSSICRLLSSIKGLCRYLLIENIIRAECRKPRACAC